MPKKSKNLQNGNQEGLERPSAKAAKPARSRRSTSTKKTKAVRKTSTQEAKPSLGRKSASVPPPTDDEIRLRAYFISERRHRLALPGDNSSDWLEARRQLLSEVGPG